MKSTRTRGKKSTPHPDPADPPRRRANKRPGHGTYDNDRPPIIHIISRETGEERCWVVGHSDKATCQGILGEAVPPDATIVYSDCNTCEGAGAGLRTFLRPFRGVHKAYLHYYIATYEALVNAKRVSPSLICRMCWPPQQPPHTYWT